MSTNREIFYLDSFSRGLLFNNCKSRLVASLFSVTPFYLFIRRLIFIFFLSLALVFVANLGYSAEVTLAWDPNTETDLAGYKIYYGYNNLTYHTCVDVGNINDVTISGLKDDQTYYFAVTAYDASGLESDYSNQVIHRTPKPDSDGDGLMDADETNIYGTDPDNADTDADGINDGDEIAYWRGSWSEDYDEDGFINILDRDSDDDGFFDGDEVNSGDDPSDPKSSPQCVKIRLEAEDGYLYAPMELAYDESASSGEYIRVPNGQGNVWNSSQDGGYAEYIFDVQMAGNYVIWARLISRSWNDDSFFVSVDDGGYALWDTQYSGIWVWDQVRNRGGQNPVMYYLDAGQHSLIIKQREDGTKIDSIIFTNDLYYIPK